MMLEADTLVVWHDCAAGLMVLFDNNEWKDPHSTVLSYISAQMSDASHASCLPRHDPRGILPRLDRCTGDHFSEG